MSNYLDIIEAAYDDTPDTHEGWVRQVTDAACRSIDDAVGVVGLDYSLDGAGELLVRPGASSGAAPTPEQIIEWGKQSFTPEERRQVFRSEPPAVLFNERAVRVGKRSAVEKAAEKFGEQTQNTLALNGGDGGCGTMVNVILVGRRPPSPRAMATFERVAIHLAAADRLRRTLGAPVVGHGAEAVLDPHGKVLHAEEPAKSARAREALSLAARAIDRARGRLRRLDATEAVEIWRGLVSGRWTLVDHVDHDGRRTLLARRNDLKRPDPKTLSAIELQVAAFAALGYSNKLIAYAAGVAPSTAAMNLARAMRRLRVRSRIELQRLLSPWLVR